MKMFKTISILICLIVGISFSLFPGENLVLNGDFETLYMDLPIHWTKEAWQPQETVTKYYTESDNPHQGKYYVTIENLQNNDARLVQEVIVKPFTYYRLSCWVKVQGTNTNRLGANLSVMHPDLLETSRDLKDTNGKWEYLEYNVRTGAKQDKMRVAIRLGGFGNDNVGKASFDDFRLEEITDTAGIVATDIIKDDGIETQASKGFNSSLIFIAALIFILVCIGGFLLYILVLKPRLDKQNNSMLGKDLLEKAGRFKFTTKDWILAGSLTLIYAIVALTNLGSLTAPQTYWKPVSRGEDVVADLGKVETIRRVYYYMGLPGGHGPDAKYEVDYSVDGQNWTHIATLGPDTIYYWYYKSTNVQARYIKLTVEKPNSWLNEIVFTGEDITKPLPIEKVYTLSGTNPLSVGSINNLFDEQDTFVSRPSHFTGMSPGFDEQYHARTAMEHIVFDDPYEDTHPPLGKLMMALGILTFGMTPFGWRFMGTLMGILMIPIMYAFGKDMFKKSEYAFFASFLMAVDFMHFTQTRIATIDSYGVFFIILMYFFMFKHYKMSFFTTDFKKTLIPLFLSGISFGLGVASKWIAVYSVAGLLIIGLFSIIRKGVEYSEMKRRLSSKTLKKDKEAWNHVKQIVDKCPKYIIITILLAVFVCFLIIPVILYFLAFVPLWFVPAINQSPRNPTIFHWVLETINGMIDYHSHVTQEHSYSSKWYEWPAMIRPMWYHVAHGLPAGQSQRLFAFGNPAIWWIGSFISIPLGLFLVFLGFRKRVSTNLKEAPPNMKGGKLIMTIIKDNRYKYEALFVSLLGFASQYVFWIIAPRKLTFIYHYFASVPFIILATVALIQIAKENLFPKIKAIQGNMGTFTLYAANGLIYAYILLALVLFIMFYPVISGIPFDAKYISTFLKWLPGWYFS
ncbi:MAG: phospholipid carrier-dependent glycosyltransferase [Spirochaetales bacterium]|nr:phospholipid carrier-dependent glycosyltransferase [Spirochaetales bacterium]